MRTHDREILIYYDPSNSTARATVAHARGLSPHIITYAYRQTPSNGTSWRQIILALGKHPKELMNKAHPYYQAHIRGRDFDDESWVKVLQYNPQLFKGPIAIRGRRAVLCQTPTDIYKLGL